MKPPAGDPFALLRADVPLPLAGHVEIASQRVELLRRKLADPLGYRSYRR